MSWVVPDRAESLPANDDQEYLVKHNVMLTIASLLSIVFFTIHLKEGIVHGIEPGTLRKLGGRELPLHSPRTGPAHAADTASSWV
jgi:hypothetical protein